MLAVQLRKGDTLIVRTRDGYEMTAEVSRIDLSTCELKLNGPAWFEWQCERLPDKSIPVREFGPDKSQGDYLRQMLEGSNGSSSDDP